MRTFIAWFVASLSSSLSFWSLLAIKKKPPYAYVTWSLFSVEVTVLVPFYMNFELKKHAYRKKLTQKISFSFGVFGIKLMVSSKKSNKLHFLIVI